MRRGLAVIGAGFLVLSCGGGDGGIPGSPGDGSGGSYYISINSFTSSKNSLNPGDSFTLNFTVNYSSPSGIYTAYLYYNNQPTTPYPLGNFHIASLNCGLGSIYTCGYSGTFNCSFDGYLSGYPRITCEGRGKVLNYTGDVYFILRACIWNENLNEVCDSKEVRVYIPAGG